MPNRPYLIRRLPSWLRGALQMIDSDVPQSLVTDVGADGRPFAPIMSTVDVFQGGLGITSPLTFRGTITVASANESYLDSNKPDPNFGYLITALSISSTVLGATRNPVLGMLQNPDISSTPYPYLASVALATSSFATWKDITGRADARIFIPPGWVPLIYKNDIAGGDTFVYQGTLYKIPAGFKPF